MNRRLIAMALSASVAGAASAMTVGNLRCEYHPNPIGIDIAHPRLSWILTSGRRAETQTAYRIIVASSREKLDADSGDVWDTGKVSSDETAHHAYGGSVLKSGQECWWKVRAWDRDGSPSAWSAPARWTMGLLNRTDWKAKWISAPKPPVSPSAAANPLSGLSWVWYPGENALSGGPKGTRTFRRSFAIPAGNGIKEARFVLTADDQFTLYVNGHLAGKSDGQTDAWKRPVTVDVASYLTPGDNTLAIQAENAGGACGLAGVLKVRLDPGDRITVNVDDSWKSAQGTPHGSTAPGFSDQSWPQAEVIAKMGDDPWGIPGSQGHLTLPPAPYLRKAFSVEKPVKSAVLYVTALGVVEPSINGRKVSDELLAPGWTDYKKRVYYRTYDVTSLVKQGDNAIGVVLADGWACGYVGFGSRRNLYGIGRPRLLAQLEVTRDDGSKQMVATDSSWKTAYGPIVEGDLLMGETYDARREVAGWDTAGADAASWGAVEEREAWPATLDAYPGVPVRRLMELKPKAITEPKPGAFVYDLAQNMVGWVRLKAAGPAGTKITMRFAEMLNPDGTVYTTNLRAARCTDTYTLRGGGEETWEPMSTFHGFRYVEVTGFPGTPGLDAITGVVVGSDAPEAGTLVTSNPLVNKLQHNVVWGQRGNFLEVPTDCPQRDERLGWMGDAEVFVRTACTNADVSAFFTKWMIDVEDAQRPGGAFTNVSPDILGEDGSPAWGDAGVIVPWTMFEVYGDKRIIERHYPAMRRFIAWMETNSEGLLRPDGGFGDWLSIGADTPKDVISTAFFAYSTDLLGRMAAAINKPDEAATYHALFERIKAAFNTAYVAPDGRIKGDTQACYVMALSMNLLPDAMRQKALGYLVDDIEKRGWRLSTGFVGTGLLNPALTNNGRTDVAYRLLLQDEFPSWLFSIKYGATTIWERWNGWTPTEGFGDPGMNSFNHYSFGAVDQWMHANIGGIDTDPTHPGFKRIVLHPRPGGGLTHARATYDSIRGRIVSVWSTEAGRFELNVTVPANTTAEVWVPAAAADQVTEGGKAAVSAEGVKLLRQEDGCAVFEVGSGTYTFVAPKPAA
ncbi:MAG TPA: glycoside hydrolase family 78 protein [Armatimonadota bacterium]|jgi:alpha-L-rhamnosidase